MVGVPPNAGSGRGCIASRPDVKVDTTRLMMVLVDDRDSGVWDLSASDLRRLTVGWGQRGGWSSPRPVGQLRRDPVGNLFPQPKSGIVTLSPVVQRTDVSEGTIQAARRWSAFSATDRRRSSIISSIAGSFRICSARSSDCWYQP